VDAFLKIKRPDNQIEDLGTHVVDEPIINGIDPSIFSLELAYTLKTKSSIYNIKSIEEAEKNPTKIQNWIEQISNLRRDKVSSSVNYSKPMPNIENLMQIWPDKFEESLKGINLPDEKINLNLETYACLVCNILDIPIHKLNSNKSIIEALHVFFSLYSEFKENQHFQMQNNKKTEENIQSKKFY
jgi:intraflagellar transport protein 46